MFEDRADPKPNHFMTPDQLHSRLPLCPLRCQRCGAGAGAERQFPWWRIAPGGALPVNTNGGGLSCVHPGMYGLFVTIEAIRQIRAAAGDDEGPREPGGWAACCVMENFEPPWLVGAALLHSASACRQ